MPNRTNDRSDNVINVDFRDRPSSAFHERESGENKFLLFDKWIREGTVCVLFDARMEGVKVPLEFVDQGDLRLNFCHDFLVPDFNYNNDSVWGTLSFDSGEFFCRVPWKCVYGMQSIKLSQGAVWFESFPKDYDQVAVLGFSEDMCDSDLVPKARAARLNSCDYGNNVVLGNFPPDDDLE